MPRFFVTSGQIDGDTVHISGDDARHISRSLRMKKGEIITVCDMQRREYRCVLSDFDESGVSAKILESACASNEPVHFIRLFQALPKSDKLDFIIQKAVECGASEIIPFESERCVAKSKAVDEPKKTARRNKISEEAAKQCGRTIIPTVRATVGFEVAMMDAAAGGIGIFCYEGDGTLPLGEVLAAALADGEEKTVSVIIGSEGGFSAAEAERARSLGLIPVGLGKRILRCETAPVFVLSCIAFASELGGFSGK